MTSATRLLCRGRHDAGEQGREGDRLAAKYLSVESSMNSERCDRLNPYLPSRPCPMNGG